MKTNGDSSKMWLFFLGGGCCSRAQVSYGIRCLSLSRLGLKESAWPMAPPGCHCHGHCQQPRATASTMATPSRQGATWGWWSGGTEPEIGGAGPAGARGRQMPAGAAASQQQQTAGGCGGEARPLLNKRLLLGVSGEPKVALRSKGLVPEGRGAVKFLHAGLLLQGPPPTSTSKEHAAVEARCVAAPDRQAAS